MSALTRRASDVRITEVDLSTQISINSNATAAMAVVASQGPTSPTFYSNFEDYSFDFGNPNAAVSFDNYMAMKFFEEGNSLWACRAVGAGALYSGVSVKVDNSALTTTINGVSGGVVNPDDPQWASYAGVGEDALFLITSKRGPGSYGDKLAISIEGTTLDTVTGAAAVQSGTGGTLSAGTFNYRIAAVGRSGEAIASSVATATVVSGTTNKITLTWSAVAGALGYYIYGRSGSTLYRIGTVGATTLTFVDTGTATPDSAYSPLTALPAQTGVFTLKVFDLNESSTKPVESFTCSLTDMVDETGSQMEITQRVNPFSKYIRVQSNVFSLIYTPVIKTVATPVAMTGGASGAAPSSADINNVFNLFLNKEMYVVDVFINSGRAVPTVQTNMELVARTRADAVAFLDLPAASQKTQQAIDYRNLTLNLNSSYAALFGSDLLISDPVNGKLLYVPPSGAMAGLYARTSRIAAQWFSIAGLNRGLLNVLGVRETFDDGQATLLFQNQVNYMRKFVGRGIPLWEQMTLYTRNSALQFLNVRFLCNVVKRSVYDFLLYGLQEPGDDILRKQLKFGLEEFLKLIQAQRGIRSYRVVIDDSTNPPAYVNSGVLGVVVIITPIIAVREIQLTLVISKEGLTITEAEISSFA